MPRSASMRTSNISPSPFTFINITNTTQIDEDNRDIIRTQAITDYHLRKRTKNLRGTNLNMGQVRGSIGKFRLAHQGLESTAVQNKHLRKTVQAQSDIPSHHVLRRGRDEVLVMGSERKPRLKAGDSSSNKVWRREDGEGDDLQTSTSPSRAQNLNLNSTLPAVNLEPLLNFPLNFPDPNRIRLWIHHYCKSSPAPP
jgi:hypothetical protein